MNKKLLAALTVPGLVFGGAAVAGAQTADDDSTVPDAESSEHNGEHRRGHRGAPLRGFAEALGLDAAELREALQSGSTLAEIAEAEGVDIDAVIETMVAEVQAKVDENPDSPRAQNFDADQLTERLQALVNGEVDFERGGQDGQGRRGGHGPRAAFGSAITDALGLEHSEIREALQGGSTIADLAEQQGVDIDAVIAGIVDDAEARVAENPDSRFAQNFDADQLEDRLNDVVNGEAEFEGRRGPGGRGGFGGPRGGAPAGAEANA